MTDPLKAEDLYQKCPIEHLAFDSTDEIDCLDEFIGQERAVSAIEFGTGIRHAGYNLFILGPPGMGKRTMVRKFLEKKARDEPAPFDWCYINNFEKPHKPIALRLACGRGEKLAQDMDSLVEELRTVIPSAFESEEYRGKIDALQEEFNRQQEEVFKSLGERAEEKEVALLRTPEGFAFAPMSHHVVIAPEEYDNLPEDKKKNFEEVIHSFQDELQKLLRQVPKWRKENREKIKELNRQATIQAVGHIFDEIRDSYSDAEDVLRYFDAVKKDVIDNAKDFLKTDEKAGTLFGIAIMEHPSFDKYRVNFLGNHTGGQGAPIVSEDNPTYNNLVGRVEHIAQLGALVTNFTLIKPGSLHRANGGYLLLDARKVLMQPYAWEGLKRALQSREIRIESLAQVLSLVSTVSLEAEPVALEVKVVLFGDRMLYYLLNEYDPEFSELFKVAADFEDRIERNDGSHMLYARLIATLIKKDNLKRFDREAVARVIEHSAKMVGDAQRLSTQIQSVADLLRESDYWASGTVSLDDVQRAIDAQIHRADRIKSRMQEEILRDTIMIDTDGEIAGQVNGLSVISMGNFSFAQPSRITATVRVGSGELINIEREVKLSGAIHSKGVLILSSFLASRFAKNQMLSFSASLTFEQSYGFVEGDSASLAELCALISVLAGIPIKQSLAVTGSINQFGQAQAIGAVNEKIEGFYDTCHSRGLTGYQGVLIPKANVKHLMLKKEVIQAVRDGKFCIYAVENIDQAIEILTGCAAGEADESGSFPQGSVNQRAASRLAELSEIRKAFSAPQKD